MNRNSHNSRGSSVNAAPRWRIVFIALLLTLIIGSVGQTPPVQAAPAGATEIEFIFESLQTRSPVCVGDKKEINVYLHRKLAFLDPRYDGTVLGGTRQAVPGISIKAAMADGPVIGQISPTQNNTKNLSGGAVFIFQAENPGESAITFEATVTRGWFGTNWGSDTISGIIYHPIKVINCKFKVTTVLQFSTGFYNLTGISSDAVMIADEQGHLTGSASMSWAYSNVFNFGAYCSYSMVAADSQVDLVGQLDEDGGQVMTTATFQPTTVSPTVSCITGTGTGDVSATVHPLTFTVDSSGGVSTQTATAEGVQGGLELEGPVSGTARVILIPEEDEAVSFISGDHQARVGPLFLRWAMQWDDFSSLFSTVLALH